MGRRTPQWDDEEYEPRGRGEGRRSNGGRGNGDEETEMLLEVQAMQQDGRIDEAIELCEEIVSTSGRPDARYYLAWMYQEEHLWDSAIEHYMTLLDDADYALSCFYALGQCYRAKGDLKRAAKYFDEAVDRVNLDQLAHDEADQLIQLCHESAQTHFELGNTEAGETVYSALLGFLRSRGWQDRVNQVEQLVQESGMPPPTPSGRVRAVQPPARPGASGVHQVPPPENKGSGFLTELPPVVPPPRPGASGVHQVPPMPAPPFQSSGMHPAVPPMQAPPMPMPTPPMAPPPMTPRSADMGMAASRLSMSPPPLPEPQRTQVIHAMRDIENYMSHGLYTAAIEECLRVIEIAPQYLDVHQALAEIYVHQGKIDQAITKYAILIDTYLVNGRIDDAIMTYRRILQLEPNNLNYRVRLINLLAQHGRADEMLRERVAAAESYLKLGYPDRAIEQFEQALVAAPADLSLRQNYALALIRASKVNQGINELQRILQMDPTNTLALARWQIVLNSGAGMLNSSGGLSNSGVRLMQGDGSNRVAALEVLSRLARTLRNERLRGLDEVVREYMAAIETSPTNGDLRYALGVIYHAANRGGEAVPQYQAAISTPGMDVVARVGMALALIGMNNAPTAVRELEEASAAVRRTPLSPALWSARPRLDNEEPLAPEVEIGQLLARAYQRSSPGMSASLSQPSFMGSGPNMSNGSSGPMARPISSAFTEEIFRTLNEISARHPNNPPAALQEMVQLVRQYRNQRQFEQAVVILNEITRLVPEDASVRSELADVHLKRGQVDEGIEDLRRAAEIHSRQGHPTEAAQALQQIGELQWQMGQQDQAMNTLKQVLSLTPDDMATRMLFVQYCLEQGKQREAAEQQTILARYYYHSRQTREAVAALQQLIALDTANYEAYDLLGQTYYAVGEYEQALRVYRQLAKANPNSSIARERINQIQDMMQSRR